MSRMSFVSVAAATVAGLLAVCLPGGCGGQYVLTVPEQVGPAGGQAVIVSRLQMVEFSGYQPAIKDLAMRCNIEKGPPRCAYTDKYGYAAVSVPLPAESGVYHASIATTDKDGREVQRFTPVYVWQKDFPVVAVDLDAIKFPATDAVKAGLGKLSQQANILYLTQRPPREHEFLHDRLADGEMPDGPILLWERKYSWHVEPMGRVNLMVLQGRMVSQLPGLKETFPRLQAGVTDSAAGVESFRSAGITPIFIGQEGPLSPSVNGPARRSNWAELADKGLAVTQ